MKAEDHPGRGPAGLRLKAMFISLTTHIHPALRSGALFAVVTAALLGAACRSAPSVPEVKVTADTYAVVNGRQITREDVEKAYRRAQPSSQVLADEELLAAKLNVLDGLIVEDLLLAKARELKVEVPEKDIEVAVEATKRNLSEE